MPFRASLVFAPFVLLLALPSGCAAQRVAPADLVIRDATVLDTRTGRSIPHRTVVIRAGRIAAVMATVPAGGGAETPPATRVIEAGSR